MRRFECMLIHRDEANVLKEMINIVFLSSESMNHISSVSLEVLEHTGVIVKNDEALLLLKEAGCIIDSEKVLFPSVLVSDCIKKVPSTFDLFTRDGKSANVIGQDSTIFNPGSTAVYFKDHENSVIRKSNLQDMKDIIHVVNHLTHIKAQSTSVIPSDVPENISDSIRLYLILSLSSKPIVTGAFSKSGFHVMKKMLEVVTDDSEELAKKPRAIFDCCPSSPLLWGDVTCQNLIDCAKSRIPAEIVPAPISGATSPVSLFGTIIQSNAEILSGIVISQLINPGTPIIYGCASSSMDMKYGVPRFSSIESIMMACASTEIGKHYGFPTHAYLGTSDSKIEDCQSGFETGAGLLLAAIAGINIVSGPGMLAQLNCQSLEKLVIDNEFCGSSYRLKNGIDRTEADSIMHVIDEVGPGGDFLKNTHTMKKYRSEQFMPSDIICRLGINAWREGGMKTAFDRAHEEVTSHLLKPSEELLPKDEQRSLDEILNKAKKTSR
jgi:trimethylamine--corrinoid protein Co-methyltransferase